MLQKLKSDPQLSSTTHLIIDEVHERSVNTDLLVTLVKELVRTRRDLKVLLMSATVNASKFSDYFSGCPIVEIPGACDATASVRPQNCRHMLHAGRQVLCSLFAAARTSNQGRTHPVEELHLEDLLAGDLLSSSDLGTPTQEDSRSPAGKKVGTAAASTRIWTKRWPTGSSVRPLDVWRFGLPVHRSMRTLSYCTTLLQKSSVVKLATKVLRGSELPEANVLELLAEGGNSSSIPRCTAALIANIHRKYPMENGHAAGAILAFLPGWELLQKVQRAKGREGRSGRRSSVERYRSSISLKTPAETLKLRLRRKESWCNA